MRITNERQAIDWLCVGKERNTCICGCSYFFYCFKLGQLQSNINKTTVFRTYFFIIPLIWRCTISVFRACVINYLGKRGKIAIRIKKKIYFLLTIQKEEEINYRTKRLRVSVWLESTFYPDGRSVGESEKNDKERIFIYSTCVRDALR